MVRNNMCIHHGHIGTDPDAHVDLDGQPIPHNRRVVSNIRVFHYGHVRTTDSYVRKRNNLKGRLRGWDWIPDTVDTFKWIPLDNLTTYEGTHPKVMKDRIEVGTDCYKKICSLYGGM